MTNPIFSTLYGLTFIVFGVCQSTELPSVFENAEDPNAKEGRIFIKLFSISVLKSLLK